MSINPYPLKWPNGWPRTTAPGKSKFSTSLAGALDNVRNSLIMFGKDSGIPVKDIVMSSNVTLGNNNPKDCAVAVWFMWEDKQLCIAVDRYNKVQDNLQAIHLVIEARRTEARHGGLHLIRQAFAGFKALPPGSTQKDCWAFLGIDKTKDIKAISDRYKELAKQYHPDKQGGNNEKMKELNIANTEAMRYANT